MRVSALIQASHILFYLGSTSKLQHLKKVFEEAIKEAESDPDGLKYWKQDGKEGIES